MARQYETLGRRFIAILTEGGPRKTNVLRALASTEQQFKQTIARLRKARLIVIQRNGTRGGRLFALAKKPAQGERR